MLGVRTTLGPRPNAIHDHALSAYRDSLKAQNGRHPAQTVHDLPFEVRASIRGCTCRVRTDPKTGITRNTMTIRFRDRRIPVLKYTTFGGVVGSIGIAVAANKHATSRLSQTPHAEYIERLARSLPD